MNLFASKGAGQPPEHQPIELQTFNVGQVPALMVLHFRKRGLNGVGDVQHTEITNAEPASLRCNVGKGGCGIVATRSEERRVGKEWRDRRTLDRYIKTI